MLTRAMGVDLFALLLILEDRAQTFPRPMYDVSCRICIDFLYWVENVPFIPSSVRIFVMTGCLVCQVPFASCIEMLVWISFFSL